MTYREHAGEYLRKGWRPIPVKGKSPVPAGCTGEAGTVDSDKVFAWTLDNFWGGQNIALRADGWLGIDADDYERIDQATGEIKVKTGASQLAELEAKLGPLPVTISSTARGSDSPSRQYLFRLPEHESRTAFITKPAADIEIIQYRHRYTLVAPSQHPDTITTYAWYGFEGELLTEIPSLDDLEVLPEAWLEYLRAPDAERAGTGFSGNVQAWLDIIPQGNPSPRVQAFIDAIPADNFGHDTMTQLAYRVVRLGAENESGVQHGIEALRREWLRGPYDTTEYRKGLEDAIDGAIKKAGAPEQPTPTMLPSGALIGILNPHPHLGTLSTAAPMNDDDAAVKRASIATEAWRSGLADDQVLTLVWNSAAGRPAQQYGVEAMWREILPARAGKEASATTVPELEPLRQGISFLVDQEREKLDGIEWWGTRYLAWTRSQVKAYNGQYHHLMMWTLLSLTLGPSARLPLGAKDVPLNFFGMLLGPTTSGKTESIDLFKRVLKHAAPHVSIGGDASVEALTEKLLERDGKSSWFNRDEAHGLIQEVKQGGSWQSGNVQKWTELYEGIVPMMLRVSKADLSGFEAWSNFVMTLIGTEVGMVDAIDAEFWTSGFLARFVWAIGGTVEETEEIIKVSFRRQPVAGGPSMAEQFAAELQRARSTFPSDSWFYMDLTEDAEDRLNKFRKMMSKSIRGHHHFERLKPTSLRFQDNVLKCAALVALSEGSKLIEVWHLLIALRQAEEWWSNTLKMIDATDETRFIREVNRVERIIAGQVGKQMTITEMYLEARRQMSKRAKEANELMDQLFLEGRLLRIPQADSTTILRIAEAA